MNEKVFQEIYFFGNSYAAISEEKSITYNELSDVCNKMGKQLTKRSLIFHICSNSIGSFVGYTAFLNNNQVQLLLSEDIEKEVLNQLVLIYHPQYLFLSEECGKKLLYNHILCGEKVLELYGNTLIRIEKDIFPDLNENLALMLTTSGSTGSPKYVRLSYKNVRENARSIANYLDLNASERPITTLPMCYTYGLSVINSHLLVGGTLLITKYKIVEKRFWDFFEKNNATSISGTPYTYHILYKTGFIKKSFPSLKTMTQAGGKLSEDLHRKFAEYANNIGIKFYVMYGQTEATARIAYLPYEKAVEKCGSIGIAIPGGKLSLLDDKGYLIDKAETVGELVYYGPNVCMGYADCAADLVKGDERKGKLYTGDIGKRDKEGYYYIVGRKKRIIKMFGNRVSLDEMETLLKDKFPGVECCCCGKDDQLYIFINVKSATFQEKLKEYVVEKTKINITGIKVKYISKFPMDESGKIQYKKLENIND